MVGSTTISSPGLIVLAGGSVGIGTTGPLTKLSLQNIEGTSYLDGLYFGSQNAGVGLDMWYNNSALTNGYIESRYDNAGSALNFRMRAAGTPVNAMTILGSGNIGIGTTSPDHKLQINGRLAIDTAGLGAGPGQFQQITGTKTAGASGVATSIWECGHTVSGRLYVIAKYDQGNVASAVFDITVAYGSGAVTRQRINNLGTVTDIVATYNNEVPYKIDVAVTWSSASAPTIYWAAEGIATSSWNAL